MVRAIPTVRSAPLLLLLLLVSPSAQAGTPRWVQVGPPSIVGGAVLYDSARDRHLVGDPKGELWAVSNDPIPVWTDLGVDGFEQGAAVYDAAHDRIVKVTPAAQDGGAVPRYLPHKVFQLVLGAAPLRWEELVTSGSGSLLPLRGYASIYDPLRQRMLLFGGVRDTVGYDDDQVHALTLIGTPTWSLLGVSGVAPPPRSLAQAVYDPWRDRMIVFGGHRFMTGNVDDTWALSLSGSRVWTRLEAPNGAPPPRHGHAMALDLENRRMIVTTGLHTMYYGDAWSLDLSQAVPADQALWTALATGGPRPTPREDAIAWIDRARGRLMLHGGSTGIPEQRIYHSASWALSLGPTPAWSPVGPDTFPAPLLVENVSAFLRSRVPGQVGRMMVGFGSLNGYEQTRDTWTTPADGMTGWRRLRDQTAPGGRNGAGLVVDPNSDRVVLFGGEHRITYGVEPQSLNDLWELIGQEDWTPLYSGIQPPGRSDALVVMDSERSRILVYGGRFGWGVEGRDDTWIHDLTNSSWSQLPVPGFGRRWETTGIHDPVRDRILAFGGTDGTRHNIGVGGYSDLFELSLDTPTGWSAVATSGTPPPPSSTCASIYDPNEHRMLVFTRVEGEVRVWSLSLSGTPTWSQLLPEGGHPRVGSPASVAMDHAAGRLLMYSSAQLWSLDLGVGAIPAWLTAVDATTERIRIVWQAGNSTSELEARRSHAGGAWESLESLHPDPAGRLVLVDRDVIEGEHYGYQLVVPGSDGTVHFGDVSIYAGPQPAPPPEPALRLDGARPNPSFGPLTLAFALETGASATLELIDITGRRVMARPVGDLGPGAQVVTLDPERRLPAGLYFARLTQGGQVRTRRVVLVR